MDCFTSKLVDKVTDFVLDATIRQICYVIRYKRRVEELKAVVEDLENAQESVKHQVTDAQNNAKEIEAIVDKWCEKAEGKINESKELSKEFENDKAEAYPQTGCSRGILPFLWHRHRLGRKATKLADEVKLLNDEKSSFPQVSYQENPKCSNIANDGYVEFGSRKSTVDGIMAKLKDSNVRLIGVLGPGGVGKTTLVKAIAKKARDNKLFDVVVAVEITRNPNRQKIQEGIAYPLGLTFKGEGENARAELLRKRLLQKRESTLLILDDLWDELNLNMLGIPFGDDDDLGQTTAKDKKELGIKMAGKEEEPSDYDCIETRKSKDAIGIYKGCKILLTSRIRDVLIDKMNVKGDSIFPVKELEDAEAVTLFKEVAGIQGDDPESKTDIVNKYCGGLPVAINMLGKTLRDKSKSVWEDVADKFARQELMGVHKSMEINVKMSYDHLESEELKSIFLLAAQVAHQPLITDLVKYCFGLGVVKGVNTLTDARDRVSDSIQKLKDSSLMLDSNSSDHFKMHDMVRDAALSIALRDQNVFALRNDKLDYWSDELERCTAISVYKSDITDELPQVIHCPQLRVFHIDSDDPSLSIPDKFFEGMKNLNVLILVGIHLPNLPSLMKDLSNLRMLCLERCELGNLSIIGDMKKLRILSLSGSKVEDWPAEFGGLSKLRLLDISDCSIRKIIPPNFISSLTSLEELYAGNSLIKTKVKGETEQSQISVLSELKHLHQLKTIDLGIPSAEFLPSNVFFDKLNDYKIVIGDFRMHSSVGDFNIPNKYEASRSLVLELEAGGTDIHSLKGIKMLFKRVENLLLGELNGVQNCFPELNLDGFPDLKHLSIINNDGIEYVVSKEELSHPHVCFAKLESLNLFNLMSMKEICCSLVTGDSFSRLKTIKVQMCSKLKILFSSYLVEFLRILETVDISECHHLEKVVVGEGGQVPEKVKFSQLRSLTLQDLPSFIGFYTAEVEQSDTTSISFVCEKVEIPNLETLKLSSIKVHKIWNNQLSNFCFENLIKLTVQDCCNLTYLCSLSVASNMKKLKGLFVSQCPMMKELFVGEGNSSGYSKDRIFPQLEEIQLTSMDMLKQIWPCEVDADSFPSLASLHIKRCNKLDMIFPCQMQGWHRSLESLEVVECESVEIIFEIGDPLEKDALAVDTKLQLILLNSLEHLKDVWSRDPEGIFKFTNMQSIRVSNCHKLSNVFPASIAKGLGKLEDLMISSCQNMEEVVKWVEGSETSNQPMVFPKVTCIEFRFLSRVKCFYMGSHTIECPNLKRLAVVRCPKLKTFTTESIDEEGIMPPVFSVEKVLSNLEYLDIDSEEAEWLKTNIRKYIMHRLKQLCLQSLPSIETLYWFLHRIPSLEMLKLISVNSEIRELVPSGNAAPQQRLGSVLQLKELALSSSYIEDIGFESDHALQRLLERLVLSDCDKLIRLAQSSVCLTHLTYLEVRWCYGLKNLMAPSTAKSLVQLTTMKVEQCPELKEIVNSEGNEQETAVDTIVFAKLITIQLDGLKKFTSFCSCKNCKFSFPSLEKLILRNCSKIKTFTESDIKAPKLQNVLANLTRYEEEKAYWEGDLNGTIRKVFADKDSFEYKSRLVLSKFPLLWYGKDLVQMQQNSFRNLKVLVVKHCGYLVHVIPSHLIACFKNLEELHVETCWDVQVIFNINIDNSVEKRLGMLRLKKLFLSNLSKLEHLKDKDPQGILGFQVLQDLSIYECANLKYVFPASMIKDLDNLKKLSVQKCEQLEGIFSEDEKVSSEENTKSFVFSSLTSLKLIRLPRLKYFHRGLLKLEFLMLKELHLHPFKWVILDCQDANLEEQVLTPNHKVNLMINNLEKLSFDAGDVTVTLHLESQKLKLENLKSFKEFSEDNGLYQFLQNQLVPNVEKLEVSWNFSVEEIFSVERPNVDYANSGLLSHLKVLKLCELYNLKSVGLEHSWIHSIPKDLQTLHIEDCSALKNIVPCTVSFSNLTNLVISGCNNLLYLLTSSTAKSLTQLKEMEIRNCESMQEIIIVSKEDDVHDESQDHQGGGDITFQQLQSIHLQKLPNLTCFYSGDDLTLRFPSLVRMSIIDCLFMKLFCPQVQINHDSVNLLLEVATPWGGDINTTIHNTMEKEIAESSREVLLNLELVNNPHFQGMWHGSVQVSEGSFKYLESLEMDGRRCEFSLEILLPSHLLPFFRKLQKLIVRNCSSVKTIFDMRCFANYKTMNEPFPLKTLKLKNLPNLESIWKEDLVGVQSFQFIQVRVDTCKSLTSLFPMSVAKDLLKLEKLKVEHCEGLVEIVQGMEGTKQELVLPCLTLLTLWDLPKLNFNFKYMVTPNLDKLSLDEKELKKIWHGNQLHKVQVLDMQVFNVESNEFPIGFLENVPMIEKFVVMHGSLNKIFCSERPNNVDSTNQCLSQLKELNLDSLSELISIGLEHSWVEESFIKNLQTLKARKCSRLRELVAYRVCYSNLMHLTVSECDDMTHLFTSSAAKTLAQLKKIEISNCKSMKEIVSKDRDEESHEDDEIIIFGQLQELLLYNLGKLRRFYDGSYTLSFPSLDRLSVIGCRRMDTFSEGTINANNLSEINLNYMDIPLEFDLNITIRKAFEEKMVKFVEQEKDLKLGDHPEVQEKIWHHSFTVPSLCFINLKTLIMERCEFLSNIAIPCHILGLLSNLQELEVRQCNSVKAIFESKDIARDTKKIVFHLKKLTLEQLPNLEYIWNADPQELVAKLEKLEVKECCRLVEIVAKDEAAAELRAPKEFFLPCVTSIKLSILPELKCFYLGPHKLECPKLKQLQLFHCDKLKTFTSESSQSFPEVQPESQVDIPSYQRPMFFDEKVIPCLEFLAIDKEMAITILHWQSHVNPLHKLQALQLQCFHHDFDTFPYLLLLKVSNIEKLIVTCSSFKEIFCSERPNLDCAEKDFLSNLKCLQLSSLSKLNSIGLEHSWMDSISENLTELQIDECHCLRNVVPCKVSFSSLTNLNVSECRNLVSLFTPSTSRTLCKLKNMSIRNCESLEEIVCQETEELPSNEIIFKELKTLSLKSLPMLGRFYNGSEALSFPSLDELSVIECRKMKSFSEGLISVNKWLTFKFKEDKAAEGPLVIDLNYTIKKAFDGTLKMRYE